MTLPSPAAGAAITFALNGARAASLTIVNAQRTALLLSVAVANTPTMFTAGTHWQTEVNAQIGDMATKLSDALDTAKEGWTADDYDALETKVKEIVKDLGQVQSATGLVGGGLYAVGAAYASFWLFALTVAGYAVYLMIMVITTRATPAGPAVQAAAEAQIAGLNTALDGMLAKLGLVAGTTGALFSAVGVAALGGMVFNPVDDKTATLKTTKIEWAPPNQWISPKKEEPVSYAEASGADEEGTG